MQRAGRGSTADVPDNWRPSSKWDRLGNADSKGFRNVANRVHIYTVMYPQNTNDIITASPWILEYFLRLFKYFIEYGFYW
jgi:hypothetical protein